MTQDPLWVTEAIKVATGAPVYPGAMYPFFVPADMARASIRAALPVIREGIAREIEAARGVPMTNTAGWFARLVRGVL